MTRRVSALRQLGLFAALGLTLCTLGCASEQLQLTTLDLRAGQSLTLQPRAGRYTLCDRYFSPQLGTLSLEQTGQRVRGTFRFSFGEVPVTGQLEGSLEGSLVRFDWHETFPSRGGTSSVHGRGFFLYDRPAGDGRQSRQSRAAFGSRLLGRMQYRQPSAVATRGPAQIESRDAGAVTATCIVPAEVH